MQESTVLEITALLQSAQHCFALIGLPAHRSESIGWVLTKMADGSAGYSNSRSREQMVHA